VGTAARVLPPHFNGLKMARAKTIIRWLWPIEMLALAQMIAPAAASHIDP